MLSRLLRITPLMLLLVSSTVAWAQDDDAEDDTPAADTADRQRPPQLNNTTTQTVTLDMVSKELTDVIKFFAEITGRNFILTDDIKGEVTIISHTPVTVAEAYEAFLSCLEVEGYTTVTVGGMTKVVPTGEASNNPLRVYEGGNIPRTDNFVTQIIQLENVRVGDISSVVKDLGGKAAKIIAYAPTNTLIITDSAINIRRVYNIINQLDVAAPRAQLEIIPLGHATAADVEKVIEELYGTAESSSSSSSSSNDSNRSSRSSRRNRNRNRNRNQEGSSASSGSATKVGAEGKYIEKIISDERTNSLIILANEEAMAAVKELIADLDVDVDPASRAQIHVIYLEHAKAADIAQVLSNLAESSAANSSNNNRTNNRNMRNARNSRTRPTQPSRGGDGNDAADSSSGEGSATAAFDDGVRITSDENTNSLVIIATPDQYRIIQSVISRLDIVRKQVFVEAVIMELTSEDNFSAGVGFHLGRGNTVGGQDVLSLFSGQTAVSSLSLTESLLTGSAMGVFGPDITTSVSNPLTGEPLTVPAFGIVLQALQANSSTNILSTPNILTMDNEQAKIVVGRNIPFPVSNSFNNNGIPVINFSREDVAITLQVTPQINESNYVTLEVLQEVQEVEDGSSDSAGGPTTSKRSAETTVVVRDNQTIVIGGLMGSTDTEVQTKVPLLGDIPLLGRFFRSSSTVTRKTNLLIFLTPHVIDEPADLEEVYRIKVAQRQEFIRRFYGKSRSEQEEQLEQLLRYSMNHIDEASEFRGPSEDVQRVETISDRSPARDRERLEEMRPISSDTDTPEDTEPAEDSVPAESPESTGSSTEDPAE